MESSASVSQSVQGRSTSIWPGLLATLTLLLVALDVRPAHADTCTARSSVGPDIIQPGTQDAACTSAAPCQIGDLAEIQINVGNQSFVGANQSEFAFAQIGGDTCEETSPGTNDFRCFATGKPCDPGQPEETECTTALEIFYLAQGSGAPLPLETLNFPVPGQPEDCVFGIRDGRPLTTSVVADCRRELDRYVIELKGGAANALPIGLNENVRLATILTRAEAPVVFPPNGEFLVRVESLAVDEAVFSNIITTVDERCTPQVSAGAIGENRPLVPAVCEVEVDKQVACEVTTTTVSCVSDAGCSADQVCLDSVCVIPSWVDVGFDDRDAESCSGWNEFDRDGETVPAETILVRYLARNTGNLELSLCGLDESNDGILDTDPDLSVPSPELQDFLGGATEPPVLELLVDRDQTCSDPLAAEEPNTATLSCSCADLIGVPLRDADVDNQDMADFECLTPGLNLTKDCVDDDGDGVDDRVDLALMNSGSADLENCRLVDEIFLDDVSCDDPQVGDATTVADITDIDLAAGGSDLFSPPLPELGGDACNTASVECDIVGSTKTITATDQDLCMGLPCQAELDKQVSCGADAGGVPIWIDVDDFCDEQTELCANDADGNGFLDDACTSDADCRVLESCTSWNAYDADGSGAGLMPAESANRRIKIENRGPFTIACTVTDVLDSGVEDIREVIELDAGDGPIYVPALAGTGDVCSDQISGVDTASLFSSSGTTTVGCECLDATGGLLTNLGEALLDSAEITCLTPDLQMDKVCEPAVDGVSQVLIGTGTPDGPASDIRNIGDADLIDCRISDPLATLVGSNDPCEFGPFDLAPGQGFPDQVCEVAGVTQPVLNQATIACSIAGSESGGCLSDADCSAAESCGSDNLCRKTISRTAIDTCSVIPPITVTKVCEPQFNGDNAITVTIDGTGVTNCRVTDSLPEASSCNRTGLSAPTSYTCSATGLQDDTLNTVQVTCDVLGDDGSVIGEVSGEASDLCEVPMLEIVKVCQPSELGGSNDISISITGKHVSNCQVDDLLDAASSCDRPDQAVPGSYNCSASGLTQDTSNTARVTCDVLADDGVTVLGPLADDSTDVCEILDFDVSKVCQPQVNGSNEITIELAGDSRVTNCTVDDLLPAADSCDRTGQPVPSSITCAAAGLSADTENTVRVTCDVLSDDGSVVVSQFDMEAADTCEVPKLDVTKLCEPSVPGGDGNDITISIDGMHVENCSVVDLLPEADSCNRTGQDVPSSYSCSAQGLAQVAENRVDVTCDIRDDEGLNVIGTITDSGADLCEIVDFEVTKVCEPQVDGSNEVTISLLGNDAGRITNCTVEDELTPEGDACDATDQTVPSSTVCSIEGLTADSENSVSVTCDVIGDDGTTVVEQVTRGASDTCEVPMLEIVKLCDPQFGGSNGVSVTLTGQHVSNCSVDDLLPGADSCDRASQEVPGDYTCTIEGLTEDTENVIRATCDILGSDGSVLGQLSDDGSDTCAVPVLDIAKVCEPQVGDQNAILVTLTGQHVENCSVDDLLPAAVSCDRPDQDVPGSYSCTATGLTQDTVNEIQASCDVVAADGRVLGQIGASGSDECEVPRIEIAKVCQPEVGGSNAIAIELSGEHVANCDVVDSLAEAASCNRTDQPVPSSYACSASGLAADTTNTATVTCDVLSDDGGTVIGQISDAGSNLCEIPMVDVSKICEPQVNGSNAIRVSLTGKHVGLCNIDDLLAAANSCDRNGQPINSSYTCAATGLTADTENTIQASCQILADDGITVIGQLGDSGANLCEVPMLDVAKVCQPQVDGSSAIAIDLTGKHVSNCTVVDSLLEAASCNKTDQPVPSSYSCEAVGLGADTQNTATVTCDILGDDGVSVIGQLGDDASNLCEVPKLQVSKVCGEQVDGVNAITIGLTGQHVGNCEVDDLLLEAMSCDRSGLDVPTSYQCAAEGLTEDVTNVVQASCEIVADDGVTVIGQLAGDAMDECVAPCKLELDKTCCIPPPPRPSGDDCQGKVLRMEFEYTGEGCGATTNDQNGKAKCSGDVIGTPAFVTLKSSAKFTASPSGGIQVGDAITFLPTENEFKSSMKFGMFGALGTQNLEIHTSCSRSLNVGDQFGSMRLTLLETTEGGVVTEPDPDMSGTMCAPPGFPEGTECDSRPVEIVFEYTGEACQQPLQNSQGGKAKCMGDPGGEDNVMVLYTGKDPDKITVEPASRIDVGDTFRLAATGRDELHSNSEFEILNEDQAVAQVLEIHTSCSQSLRLGDEFGSLRVVGFTTKDGDRVELADPDAPLFQQACSLPAAPPAPHCTSKPTAVTFRYLGGSCADQSNGQGSDSCAGDDPGPGNVWISITEDADEVSANPSDSISVGDTFTISRGGEKLKSSTEFEAMGLGGTQALDIHTSCSKPLNLGDTFGAFEVFALDREDEGPISLGGVVEYQYTVTNPDSQPVVLTRVADNRLGDILEGDPISIDPGDSVTLFKKGTLFETTENLAMAFGERGATQCGDTDTVTVTIQPPPPAPFTCDKPIDALTMIWNGTSTIGVRAWKGSVGSELLADVDGVVPGVEVEVTGYAGSPNDVIWELFADGTTNKLGESVFHLSCSDDNMNGSEDCGKVQGNGKDKSGFVNTWLLEGMVDQSGVLDCTPDLAAPTSGNGGGRCGLGFELAFLLPGIVWLRRRRSARAA